MPDAGISLCPICGYSLEGLPPPHRCPECGFEYDEHTRVWFAPRTWVVQFEYFWPLLSIFMIFAVLFPTFYMNSGRPIQLLFIGCAMAGIAIVLRLIARQKNINQKGQCAAVTPRGLFIRHTGGEEWIDWPDVGKVFFSSEFDYVTRSNSVRTTPLPAAFPEDNDKSEFTAAVKTGRAFYVGHTPNPPSAATHAQHTDEPMI